MLRRICAKVNDVTNLGFKNSVLFDGDGKCLICSKKIAEGERIAVLDSSCDHIYHDNCLNTKKCDKFRKCPNCERAKYPDPLTIINLENQ